MNRPELDYVLTLVDLRQAGVDFTWVVTVRGGEHYNVTNREAEVARLQLVSKAATLRTREPRDDFDADPHNVRCFIASVLDVRDSTTPQAVAGCDLTMVAQFRRRLS